MRDHWVQLSTIVGNTAIPPEAAAIIRQAVTQIATEHHISPNNRWRCLEYLAADYLAGEHQWTTSPPMKPPNP